MSGGIKVIVNGTGKYYGTYVGEFAPASGLPTTGSGTNGKILKGDYWKASANGTIASLTPYTLVVTGDLLFSETGNASLAADFFVISAQQVEVTTAIALVDASTIDLTSSHHTLTTATGRTFTKSWYGDSIKLFITLTATSATHTFPSGWLCRYNGTESGNNTLSITGATSGDLIAVAIEKAGSRFVVAAVNFGQ